MAQESQSRAPARMTRAEAIAAIGESTAKRGRFPVAPAAERTIDGIVFASKKEAKRYAELKMLERAGEIYGLELQPEFRVSINGVHVCTYTADFRYMTVHTSDFVVEDTKSSGTRQDPYYRLRKRLAEAYYSITLVEV